MTTYAQQRMETKAQARLGRRQALYDAAAKKDASKYSTGAFHRPGSSKKAAPRGKRMPGTGGRPQTRQNRMGVRQP